jgi:hypothetical protein
LGALWEILEFAMDQLFGTNMRNRCWATTPA